MPTNERIEEKILKILINPRTVYADQTFRTFLATKYILAPFDQLMATPLQPRYSHCLRTVKYPIAQ